MGFRFRKRIKILPGVHLNVGKTGISASAGVKGAQVTVGKRGTTTTVGIPGSGLSHTQQSRAAAPPPEPAPSSESSDRKNLLIGIAFFIALGLLGKACSVL